MAKIVAVALVCPAGVCGACGAQEERAGSVASGAAGGADISPQSFAVRLETATTEDNANAQIANAVRGELAAVCGAEPGGSVRIYNPLAPGAHEDIPCASVLAGEPAIGEASAALIRGGSDGPIGVVQEKWSPVGLACTLLWFGIGQLVSLGCAQHHPGDYLGCSLPAAAGSTALGYVWCQLL